MDVDDARELSMHKVYGANFPVQQYTLKIDNVNPTTVQPD
jgi:hypothetical protein